MPLYSPALDLILNLADKSAVGRLALLGSRVVSSSSSSSFRIVRADTGLCRVRGVTPNLAGERAFDDVDLSISTVRIALGVPGSTPYCLATLATPFPSAAAQITTPQSATSDLPSTKRVTLDPAPYAGHLIITLDALAPFEIPFDAEADQIKSLAGTTYKVRKRAANVWEISGTDPGQDVAITVDVSGLSVPSGLSGAIALNTVPLAAAFTALGNPKWLRVTLEVEIDGVKVYQNDNVQIARELINLSTLVPAPIPPSDYASLSALISGKQALNSQLSAISSLATTSWGRFLLTLADAGALRTYASLQPLSAQLTAIAALAGAAYGRGLLTQANSAALRSYIAATFANLPDKPTTIAGYGITDFNSLGDARWSQLLHAAAHALGGSDPITLNQSQITSLVSDLAAKAPLASPALTGTPTAPTAANATSNTQLATTSFVHALFTDLVNASPATLDTLKELADAIGDDPNFAVTVANSVATKLAKALNLSDLTDPAAARGNLALGNVDNTSDANKPVSTAQAAADTAVANTAAAANTAAVNAAAAANAIVSAALATHSGRTDNPHAVTKSQVGLANADNTADANKPISTAQQAALDTKVGKTGDETIAGAKTFLGPVGVYSLAGNSIAATVLATPGAPIITRIGAAGATTWTYKIVAKLSDGTTTAASPAGSLANGDETLDNTNKNSLAWSAIPGAVSYDVYRTAAGVSPSTTGKIANVLTNAYIDTGAAGDGTTAPTFNSTGHVTGALIDNGGTSVDLRSRSIVVNEDITAKLIASIGDAQAVGGPRRVYIPSGKFRITSLVTHSGIPVALIGAGNGFAQVGVSVPATEATELIWDGPPGGIMFDFRELNYGGHGISRMKLNGAEIAADVLQINGSLGGRYDDLNIVHAAAGSCLKLTGTLQTPCLENKFIGLSLGSDANGKCCLWLHDGSENMFFGLRVDHGGNRDGIYIGGVDNNDFFGTIVRRAPGGTGRGVLVDPSEAVGFPHDNDFYRLSTGAGGFVILPGGLVSPGTIYGLRFDNGEPAPVTNGCPLNVEGNIKTMLWTRPTPLTLSGFSGQGTLLTFPGVSRDDALTVTSSAAVQTPNIIYTIEYFIPNQVLVVARNIGAASQTIPGGAGCTYRLTARTFYP